MAVGTVQVYLFRYWHPIAFRVQCHDAFTPLSLSKFDKLAPFNSTPNCFVFASNPPALRPTFPIVLLPLHPTSLPRP
jgi:hypothetical protein